MESISIFKIIIRFFLRCILVFSMLYRRDHFCLSYFHSWDVPFSILQHDDACSNWHLHFWIFDQFQMEMHSWELCIVELAKAYWRSTWNGKLKQRNQHIKFSHVSTCCTFFCRSLLSKLFHNKWIAIFNVHGSS